MSVPLAKARSPAPRSTSTRTAGSASSAAHASWSASYISNVIELRASGRLKVSSAVDPSRSTRSARSSDPSRGHPEAPVADVLVQLLTAALGAPALLRQLLEPVALFAAPPIEEHPDPLGSRQLLSQEVVQVGMRARHDEEVTELGHLLFGLLSSGAHVELVEDSLGLCAGAWRPRRHPAARREGAAAQHAGRDERAKPQRFGEAQRLFVTCARLRRVRGAAARSDVAEHLERLRLVAALTV